MKKLIIYSVIFFVVGAVLSPVIGMAIGGTRNIILGLAPQEAVLSLADEIDKSRIENETKIQEMQAKIDEQEVKIEEQNQKIVEVEKTEKEDVTVPDIQTIKNIASDVTYCQTNASKYSIERFGKEKKRAEESKDDCEKIEEIGGKNYDCKSVYNKSMKEFDEYKLAYDAYHKKCD